MPEHEVWLTRLFNDSLAPLGRSLLGAVKLNAENPGRPWTNFITMELLVALIIIVVFAILRGRLSMDRPGKLQHTFEAMYQFLKGESLDNIAITAETPNNLGPLAAQSREDPEPYSLPAITTNGIFSCV